MTKLLRYFYAGALLVSLLGRARPAHAQGFPGGMGGPPGGGFGGGGGQKKAAPAPNPNEPVTHAASGASDESMRLGGAEPSLPADPLEISPEVKAQIGTDADPEREIGRGPKLHRLIIPPYYAEKSGTYSFKTVFPFWAERKQPDDRASLFGPVYYNRRSKKQDADILFPLIWHLRDEQTYTTVVGPFVHQEKPMGHDNWLVPLVFSGATPSSGYLHIPPLLTFTHYNTHGGFNWIGLYYCSWKGSSICDAQRSETIDYGLPPLFFAGKSERSRYEFVPPLLHYFHYSELDDSSLNIWGPLMWQHRAETDSFNILPLFYRTWGKNENHVTFFPLFHYGYKGNSNLIVNPLFFSSTGEHGESTFATYVYARYRGRTKLDMITPFYWHFEDPDVGLTRTLLFPFLYLSSSPRGDTTGVFPFYLHTKREGLSESTWVTPLFEYSHSITGWSTNFYPIVFTGRTYNSTHTVIAPIFWDFATPKSRTTVGFPLYWRFADEDTVSQLAGNTYYHERRVAGGLDWEFHFFPAFSYGESPDGHWWNILYGLAGYTRQGPMTKVRALWIPITLSDAAPRGE